MGYDVAPSLAARNREWSATSMRMESRLESGPPSQPTTAPDRTPILGRIAEVPILTVKGLRRRVVRTRAVAAIWLREIWRDGWDGHRRILLFRHYGSYLRFPSIPTHHVPDPPKRPASTVTQAAFSEAYRDRIAHVQATAGTRTGVFLTFRPIGKNIRLMGTALRSNVDRGRATFILRGGPPTEEQALESAGRVWCPWIWSRPSDHRNQPDELARDTAAGWGIYFKNPKAVCGGRRESAPVPILRHGDGPFSTSQLALVLKLAAATSYVFEPVLSIEDDVVSLKKELKWPALGEPVLGMHIRRGDAATSDLGTDNIAKSTRTSFPLSAYLNAADRLCHAYGIRHIYIATESADDISRARQMRPNYTFLNLDHDRSMFPAKASSDRFIEYVALDDPPRARALAVSAILDLCLFRECGAFVGAFNSEFSVLAWLLAIGGQRHLIPYISLSTPRPRRSANPFEALLSSKNNCPLELYHW